MTDERYKQIMKALGYPESQSLLDALKQVANEAAQEQSQALRDELAAVKTEQLSGYIENMRQLENEANLQDKAGLRMMCSFAVKTATEYANQVEKGQ